MYTIAVLRNVYQPDIQGESQPQFYTDNHGLIVEFETIEEAQALVAEWKSGVIVIGNNEYAAPDYHIVDVSTAEYVLSGRGGDMSNYEWEGCICECGECADCIGMMIEQDCDYIRSRAEH